MDRGPSEQKFPSDLNTTFILRERYRFRTKLSWRLARCRLSPWSRCYGIAIAAPLARARLQAQRYLRPILNTMIHAHDLDRVRLDSIHDHKRKLSRSPREPSTRP